jgi:hypothetical protein
VWSSNRREPIYIGFSGMNSQVGHTYSGRYVTQRGARLRNSQLARERSFGRTRMYSGVDKPKSMSVRIRQSDRVAAMPKQERRGRCRGALVSQTARKNNCS